MASSNPLDYNALVASLLSPDCPIPSDITFRVMDKKGIYLGDVSAHKFILSLVSPISRSSFFGSDNTDRDAKVLETKETTMKAFRGMVDFIYKKEVNFEQMSVREMFDLVDLAEYYHITELQEVIRGLLNDLDISRETVMEVAAMAEEFTQYDVMSKTLLGNCARVLNTITTDRKSFIDFSSEVTQSRREVLWVKLISLMKNLQPPVVVCSNCQETPCRSGMLVTDIQQVKEGTILTGNKESGYFRNSEREGNVVVKSVDISRGRVLVNNCPGHSDYYENYPYSVVLDTVPVFFFMCAP